MIVNPLCHLDFRSCASCQAEMQVLINAIYLNTSIHVAIKSVGYVVNPTYTGYQVDLMCSGTCMIDDNTLSKTADITAWAC